ncbi:MAG: hypothetical protein JKY53_11845 [Flavobacteriales bacterium]|nr:hypothetical protein [Flavobacteriales bacterium]
MSKLTKLFAVLSFCVITLGSIAQDRFDELKHTLDVLSADVPGLNEQVELSVSGVSLQEFMRGIASAHNLNVSINPSIKINVVNNFSNARVADVLLFVCKQYDLDINFIGSIMSFNKYVSPPAEPIAYKAKNLKITYNNQTDFLSIDLKRDSLDLVVREITKLSFKNVVIAPELENELVSGYIQNRPFANTLEKLAFANNLKISSTDDNFFLIEKNTDATTANNSNSRNNSRTNKGNNRTANKTQGLILSIDDNDMLTVDAKDVSIAEIVDAVATEALKSYFLFSEPQGNTTLYIENVSFDDFMTYLLNGSDYTYKVEEQVYLIGERKLERLRTTKMVQLQNRTVESIIDYIPAELKTGVDIKEFLEMNSLVLSGSTPQIIEIEKFIREVDLVVPVILIDVMVLDVSNTNSLSTGLKIGVGNRPGTEGEGTLYPGLDFGVSTGAINDLLGLFNGYGIINLGQVVPDFYVQINALESEGLLNKKSTPKLATLNGHEASMSIGETEYYAETSSNIVGNQTIGVSNSIIYKSQNADLSIKNQTHCFWRSTGNYGDYSRAFRF